MHLDIVRSLHPNADLILPVQTSFVFNENFDQSNLDYESYQGLEIADYHTSSSEIDNDMPNDSNAEDVSLPPLSGRPLSQATIWVLAKYSATLLAIQS